MERISVRLCYDLAYLSNKVVICKKEGDKLLIASEIKWVERTPFSNELPINFALQDDDSKVLMNDLVKAGVSPTKGFEFDAMKLHLEDMRRLYDQVLKDMAKK